MLRCVKCSADVFPGHRFCAQCGSRLASACPNCGTFCHEDARTCEACGESIELGGSGKISRSTGLAASAEYRHASIVFADIVGSTNSIAHLDAETALENFIGSRMQMEATVARHGGTIIKTTGDGIIAVFGAPKALEGHIHLACEAALDMRDVFNSANKAPLRIGVHTGQIIFSECGAGSPERWDVHGLDVHIACRVQEVAKPGTVFATEQCVQAIGADFLTRSEGLIDLKGVPQRREIFQLLDFKGVSNLDVNKPVMDSYLRGRDAEIVEFQQLMTGDDENRIRILGISGAPGVGKTRLCYEFARLCARRGFPVYEAHAKPYGYATPLQLALNIVRSLIRIPDAGDITKNRRRIEKLLAGIGPSELTDRRILSEFLGLILDASDVWTDPKGRHSRLVEILRHLIVRLGKSPAVIVVEDIHWADDASMPFVEALVDTVPLTKLLLLLNSREGFPSRWVELQHFREMRLDPLPAESVKTIVEELIGSQTQLAGITNQIVVRSAGNPFFARELVRSLIESGTLLVENGTYSLSDALLPSLPFTIQDVIGSRIDRLLSADRRVLQIASVVGKDFDSDVLAAVEEFSTEDLVASLGRLCVSEIIRPSGKPTRTSYAFSHPLLHEVAYSTMLKARRATIHAAVAMALSVTAGDDDEKAALLSYHYESAGDLEQAAVFSARAAKWLGSTNPAEAISHWRKTRQFLQRQGSQSANDSLRAYASAQIAWLGWREGLSPQEARPFIDEAIGWAKTVDEDMLPLLLFVEARLIGAGGGSAAGYIQRVRESLELTRPSARSGRAGTLYAALCQAYGWHGLYREALYANDMACAELAANPQSDNAFLGYSVEHWVKSLRGRIFVHLGRFEDAERLFDQMLGETAPIDATVLFISHLGKLEMAWWRRDSSEADYHAYQIGRLAELQGSAYLNVFRRASAGIAEMISGRNAAALRAFSDAVRISNENNVARDHQADVLAAMSECVLKTGDLDAAARSATKAIAAARQISACMPELRATIVLAAATWGAGSTNSRMKAERHFKRATELIGTTGATVFESWLVEEHAKLDAALSAF